MSAADGRKSRGRSSMDPEEVSSEVGWLRLVGEGRLVLASASPRRAALLDTLGVPYRVHPSGVRETDDGSEPGERVLRLAEAKALDVAASQPGALVLGADTEVVLDGSAVGKPRCPRDAHRILLRLRGKTHQVLTGLFLLDVPTGLEISVVEKTSVTMGRFSDAEAAYYAYSGEPLDKAGAYGIQGFASVFVERIEGCYYNVVGLPLRRLTCIMEEMWGAIEEDR